MASLSSDAAGAVEPGQDIQSRFVSLRGALPIPTVSIPLINDKSVNLAAFRGSLMIVNFWATWCPGCREELLALHSLANRRIPGLEIVSLAADREPRKKVSDFAKALGLSKLAIGLAPEALIDRRDQQQASPFVLYTMPISYLIGRSGVVEGDFLSRVSWSGGDILTASVRAWLHTNGPSCDR